MECIVGMYWNINKGRVNWGFRLMFHAALHRLNLVNPIYNLIHFACFALEIKYILVFFNVF
jgi:hypothetical protein